VALGGVVGVGSGYDHSAAPTALVIDAALARDGRDLVDPRLESAGAEVRLPRTSAEARTNVRYFTKAGYRVVVAGSNSSAAGAASAVPAPDLTGALAAIRR
jgi:FAD/FMN-containing dehydrogenase